MNQLGMRKGIFRPWASTLIVVLLGLILIACGGAEEPTPEPTPVSIAGESETVEEPTAEPLPPTHTPEPPTATPLPEPTATEEVAPTEAPTEVVEEPTAEPTPIPEPTATAAPQNIVIEDNGVTIEFPPALNIIGAVTNRLPAFETFNDGSTVLLNGVPEFIEVVFQTDQGPGEILIRPIRDENGALYPAQSFDLQTYYQNIDVQIASESEGRIDQQQLAYIPFENGNGLRAVSYEFDNTPVAKITNQTIYYYYDGVTTDGRYYIDLKYPVDAQGFTQDGQFTEEELVAAAADFNAYVIDTMSPLNELDGSQFAPAIPVLDELVNSIEIAPDASTAVSELTNCFYDATFVEDVTIPDASVINPGEPFQKIWRVNNAGSCDWDSSYSIAFSDGEAFGWTGTLPVGQTAPGEPFDIVVDLEAPVEPGIYEGRWQLLDPLQRQFGVIVYVTIVVPEEPVDATDP